MKKKIMTITDWVHSVLASSIEEGDFCIDATAGKGKDTLFLAEKAGESGQVLAFDIQEEAIFQAEQLINDHGYREQVRFVLDGHEHMERYADKDSAAVILFNLGYLPEVTTLWQQKNLLRWRLRKRDFRFLKSRGSCVSVFTVAETADFLKKKLFFPGYKACLQKNMM